MSLALRKMGFSAREIEAMPLAEALEYLDAYADIVNPPQHGGKTYRVRRHQK